MRTSTNEKPFELLGFAYADYKAWCEKKGKKEKSRDSKKEFFKLALECKIIKRNGALIDLSEGE